MKTDIKYYSTTRKLAIELSIISLNYSVRTQKTDLGVFWFVVQRREQMNCKWSHSVGN